MLTQDDLVFCSPSFAMVPLLDRLGPVAAAGFKGISLLPTDIWALEEQGMSAREIATRIADAGLEVAEMDCISCWMPRHETQDDRGDFSPLLRSFTADRVIATAERIGARSVVAADLMTTRPSFDEAVEGFARVCDLAAEHGLRTQIEFVSAGGIPDLLGAWEIVKATGRDNGGLAVDSWHHFRTGGTVEQLASIPGERVHSVQINDAPAQPQADLWEELMTSRLLPGEGSFDLTGFIRALDAIGSTTPIGVEVFNDRQLNQDIRQVAEDSARTGRAAMNIARRAA